jgi:hypothetical protein
MIGDSSNALEIAASSEEKKSGNGDFRWRNLIQVYLRSPELKLVTAWLKALGMFRSSSWFHCEEESISSRLAVKRKSAWIKN